MNKELIYWGTWKGRVVKAISIDGAQTWKEIREQTGMSPKSLNIALRELMTSEVVEKRENGKGNIYRVSYNIYKEYKEYFENSPTKNTDKVNISEMDQKALIQWIDQWNGLNNLGLNLEPKHFYLQGSSLDEFSKKIIGKAKKEVLVVNPFVDRCDLSNSLKNIAGENVHVRLITREPDKKDSEKKAFLESLKTAGVEIVVYPGIHAKLIVTDRIVGIASSMNFYSGSSAGKTWEAGLVSFDPVVTEDMTGSILSLLEDDLGTEF